MTNGRAWGWNYEQTAAKVDSNDVPNARLVAATRCARVGVLCAVWGVCVFVCSSQYTCMVDSNDISNTQFSCCY